MRKNQISLTINRADYDGGMFSIYEILPEILELWGTNLMTDVESKKTSRKQPGDNDGAVPAVVSGGRAFANGSRPPHHRDGAGYLDGKRK